MISFENGILRIERKKRHERTSEELNNAIRLIYEITFCLGQVFYFGNINDVIHYGGAFVLIAGALMVTFSNLYHHKLNKTILSAWYLGFFILAEVSSLWSYAPETAALKYARYMIVILITCFGMTQYVNSKEDVEHLLTSYACAALILMTSEFLGTPFENLFSGYFGSAVNHNNTNYFGYFVMMGSIIAFYKAYIKGKILWYPAMLFMVFGCFISSSRKSSVMSVVGILMVIFFSFQKKHHFLHLLIALTVAAALFIFVMSNEDLYVAVGNRLESLLSFMQDERSVKYGSLQKREFYIAYAKTLFESKPVAGYGMACFGELLHDKQGKAYIYAHNNYWETLADLGVIGFVVYYWFYAYLIIKLISSLIVRTFNEHKALALALLTAEVILEWGLVSSWYMIEQTVIAIIFLCAISDSFDNKKFYYSGNDRRGG